MAVRTGYQAVKMEEAFGFGTVCVRFGHGMRSGVVVSDG